ncbi:molybdopterin-dependent oxidoreductase [Vibrio sp. AK197]
MSKSSLLNAQITRRKLLEYTGEVGVTSALLTTLSTVPFSKKAQAQTLPQGQAEFKHSACLVNCGSRCALKVKVENDRIIQIEPEPAVNEAEFGQHQIRPCLRGRSNKYRVYNPDRLKYPMKRIGKRGEGKFERISWEEATQMIANEMTRIRQEHGNEAVYYQYGTGAYYHTQGSPAWHRLLNLTGGYLNYFNTYSTGQINKATPYTYGNYSGSHFTEVEDSDLVVLFGLNVSETRMSGGGQVEELRRALEKSNAQVVILDPRYTDSVIAENAEWLPIRPTSDAAVVAALVHTMITEDLIDEDNINKYAVGFSRETLPASAPENSSYKDYVMGTGEDGIVKTAQWASDISGIPAKRIQQLARQIANAKSCFICQGWGPQRHHNGEQTVRSILNLPIIANQFGRPGTNSGLWPYGNKYGVPKLPAGENPVKVSIPVYTWTDAIARPETITSKTHALKGADKLNVGIKMIISQASNVLANQHGNLNATREILQDESLCETIVVVDNHMTATARFADILLPETTYLEADDLVDNSYASGSNCYMISMEKTITPLWEVRSTYDVCRDIAKHLGVEQQFSQGRTQQQWIEKHYQDIRSQRTYLPEFSQIKGSGIIDQHRTPKKDSVAYQDFYQDPNAHPLSTPSGKIEIYSEQLVNETSDWILPAGDKIPAVGQYLEVPDSQSDKETQKKFPIQLTGFHTKGHAHSTYASVGVVKEAVPNEIWINFLDAESRGITNGDMVRVFNDRGSVLAAAKVTHRILPEVAALPEGVWSVVKNGVDIGGCINSLTSHRLSPWAKGNPQHTNLVEIEKA